MPNKIKKCFFDNLTFEKLLQAHLRARKHKTYKQEVINFEINLENNIINLINKIKVGKYKLGTYRIFIVKEPKEREIKSLPYIDRVVHQWYVEEFIKPYIVPRFIKDTYACIENRGTHKAVYTIQNYMRMYKRYYGDFWILKCDIKKFFNNIDSHILFKIMENYVKDTALLSFTKILIFDNREENEPGIPIGNYTSQFFANIYLNELDQYIKHELKIKYYVRYMDDFILLAKTKEECKVLKEKVELFCSQRLKLELNHKSRYYPYKFGLNFCGYRIWTTHRLLRTNSKTKIKRCVKTWNKLWMLKKINFNSVTQSLNSWMSHASHSNSYKLKQSILKKCDFIYDEFTSNQY